MVVDILYIFHIIIYLYILFIEKCLCVFYPFSNQITFLLLNFESTLYIIGFM